MADQLQPGEALNPDQSIASAGGRYRFVYQGDCNLVLYDGATPLWASGTDGQPVGVCIMQGDGNLVIYAPGGQPIWSSDTWQHPGSRLVVQDDGNVVIYRPDGTPVWATNTVQPTVFVRREAWALQATTTFDPITLAYATAIQVMQARPASDPTSWTYQAAIHATFAVPPAGVRWNDCQHQSWFFLPWHRMYLYYFERIVRKAVLDAGGPADFALPYWNYEEPFPGNTLPPAFRAPTLPDGTANPLFVPSPRRSAALMSGGQVPAAATSSTSAMAMTNFAPTPTSPASFGGGRVGPAHFGGALGALESSPHNVMHPTIGGAPVGQCQGGLMTDPRCAALDPIFWLHHANIDRLWNNWLALGGGRANPSEAAWLTQTFVFHDETGARVTLSGADVIDSASQLGYAYDDAPARMVRIPEVAPTPSPSQPPELAAASEEPLELGGARASVPLAVPRSSRNLVEAASDQEGRVLISVEDIEAESDPGLAYAVYLDVPGDPDRERRHIGNVSFFGIETMNDADRPHDGAPGFRHTFDATEVVRTLKDQNLWDPAAIAVTFEPIRVLPPPGEDLPPEAEAQARAPVAPVRVGRVSLFVA